MSLGLDLPASDIVCLLGGIWFDNFYYMCDKRRLQACLVLLEKKINLDYSLKSDSNHCKNLDESKRQCLGHAKSVI